MPEHSPFQRSIHPRWLPWLLMGTLAILPACSRQPTSSTPAEKQEETATVVVDVAIAATDDQSARTYTGTTAPTTQVTLKAQAEGQLLTLIADVGDRVQQGQPLATLDDDLLQTAVGEAEAELAARKFEVAQAEAQLADIRTLIEQAKVRLQQAQADTDRLLALASQGAVSDQEAEQAQTTLRTAQQAYQSAQEQLRTRQQAVAAAQQRATAQQSVVAQAQKRLSYTSLTAPLTGVVLERLAEPGDVIQPGQGLLTLGNLQEIEVVVDVADNNLQQFTVGQSVKLQFDALPGQTVTGQVTNIAPIADRTSRLVPVEITVANPDGRIGSGMLARLQMHSEAGSVSVPQSALALSESVEQQLFVVTTADGKTTVSPRPVTLGEATDGLVEVLTGLKPGERYVVRSSQPLQPNQVVEPSLTSEG